MAISSRPEIIKARRKNEGKLTHLAFPSKPMPHGLLLQFYDYDYSKYIAGIKQKKLADILTLPISTNYKVIF